MPRINLRLLMSFLACTAACLTATAQGDETSPPEPPTVALPAHHPISRDSATGRASTSTASPTSSSFWLSTGGVAVALAAFGFVSLGARKLRPNPDASSVNLKVIGRASLSPRQSVYLLKAGNRVLIVGAGGQGPPSLLGELTDADREVSTPADRKDGGSA